MTHTRSFILIILSLNTPSLVAKELGKIGATFPIGEIDMLTWIDDRLKRFEANGRLAQMQQEMTEQVKRSVETPPPIPLSTTTAPSVFTVDASLKLAKDIIVPDSGHVIAKAGTVINPFDSSTWPSGELFPQFEYSHALAFFDARDKRQVTWAAELTSDKPIKWVLTGGSPNETALILDSRIYFDQQGHLTQKLHLQSVPSLVQQRGTLWEVTEFDVSRLEPWENTP